MDLILIALIGALFTGVPIAYVTYQKNKQDQPGADVDRLIKVADRLERDADRLEEERDEAMARVVELEQRITAQDREHRVRLAATQQALERERTVVKEKEHQIQEMRETIGTLRKICKQGGLEDVS